jgi:hypothetical protein
MSSSISCRWSSDKDLLHCEFLIPAIYRLQRPGLTSNDRFCKHIFPMLPIISRSQLGISSTSRLPPRSALERVPLHLLAAIYASALRFVADDEHLSVWHSQTSPSTEAIWRLVYEELQEDVHQSQLSVVQAALLYLHKDPSDDGRHTLSDTPFVWSWVGKVVGLTTALGIHTECSMWAIPSWEKRLRKRIWWAVYAEDKWRSLLMGRPPYIHPQEWDIEDLDTSDFRSSSPDKPDAGTNLFRNFVSLTRIAESVQTTFYSLRAAQRLPRYKPQDHYCNNLKTGGHLRWDHRPTRTRHLLSKIQLLLTLFDSPTMYWSSTSIEHCFVQWSNHPHHLTSSISRNR